MKQTIIRTVAASALFLAAPGFAESPSYNFVQGGYQQVEIDLGDGFDADGDGLEVGGSFEVGEQFFVFASYGSTDFDFDIELTQLQAGLGYHTAMSDNTDLFATASFVEADVDVPGFGSADDSGYAISVGLRSNVSDLVELFGQIAYADLGDDADSTAIGGGIWFNINESFALGVNASADDDVTAFGASVRVYFDY